MYVDIAPKRGLRLKNPVIIASGTFGYGDEFAAKSKLSDLGGFISKGTTLRPRAGNPPLRMWETRGGMLNAIGLQNIGIERVVREKAPVWREWQLPVLVNISGSTIDEFVACAVALDGIRGISGLEINVSCPNVKAAGVMFGTQPALVHEVTREVRTVTSLPLVVKLSPNVTDIQQVATAAEDAGADAVSLINTLFGMAIDSRQRRTALASTSGGLSGPAIKPLALYLVYQVAQVVSIPIIGYGGIMNSEDALEFLFAGATAVGLATALLVDPGAWRKVVLGLDRWCRDEGVHDIETVIGCANPGYLRGSTKSFRLAGVGTGEPE